MRAGSQRQGSAAQRLAASLPVGTLHYSFFFNLKSGVQTLHYSTVPGDKTRIIGFSDSSLAIHKPDSEDSEHEKLYKVGRLGSEVLRRTRDT